MKNFYLIILLLFTHFYNSQNHLNWQILNPKPTSNVGKDILFLSETDGFYITDKELVQTKDAGNSWSIKKNINSGLDIDFKNNIGFIVGNLGSAYLSSDRGDTWSVIKINSSESFTYCKIISENILIAASNKSIYFSTDRGLTWSNKSINIYNPQKIYFLNENIGFLGTGDGKMYKTIDGGNSWVLKNFVNYSPANYFTIYFYNEQIGFAERGHGELLKTEDGGETWNKINSVSDHLFSFHFLNEKLGYATGEMGVTFKTTDGGINWQNIFFQTGRVGGTDMNGIFFTSENIGYAVGSSGRIIKTIDGGQNWSSYSPFYNNVNNINIVDNEIFARVGLFTFHSKDDGTTWEKLNRPSDFIPDNNWSYTNYSAGMKFINKNVGYLIGGNYNGDSKIFKTIDGGNSWILKKKFDVYGLNNFDFINENIGFVCGGQGTMGNALYKTIDGGDTWILLNTSYQFRKIKAYNENLIYASTYGNLFKSLDGGQNWTLIFNDDYQEINDFYFTDQNTLYLVGNSNLKLQKSIDGGKTWKKYELPYGWNNLVRFKTNNIGFVASEYGQIYLTFDGGRSWKTDNYYYGDNDMLFINSDIYLASDNGKILKSSLQNIPDFTITTIDVSNITNKGAVFNGFVASNALQIDNLMFEFSKTSDFTQTLSVSPNKQIIESNFSDDLYANVSNLEESTKYHVRLTGNYNGQKIYSNSVTFTTLPNFTLKLNEVYPYYASSVDLYGVASAIGNDITNIEFEYSENQNQFTNSSISNLQTIAIGSKDVNLNSDLINLKPETTYYARIKAKYENNIIYSNLISFKTAKEYIINLNEAYISGDNVYLNSSISSNYKEITDIVLEYGYINFENSITTSPSQVSELNSAYIYSVIASSTLLQDKNYSVRLKAKTNNKTIYSNIVVFNLNKTTILERKENEIISENSIKLNGLIKTYDYYPLTNISFEYGKTEELGNIVSATPNYYYNSTTLNISSSINSLEANQKYYYRISAIQNGVKKYSDLYNFTLNSLSIPNSDHKISLLIYPNPVKNILYFKNENEISKIEIFDLTGKLILSQTKENIEYLDLKNLLNSTYIIKFYTKEGIISKKIIKQ